MPGNTTEQNITGLRASTDYQFIVSAVYLTNTTMSAKVVTGKTARDPSAASKLVFLVHVKSRWMHV